MADRLYRLRSGELVPLRPSEAARADRVRRWLARIWPDVADDPDTLVVRGMDPNRPDDRDTTGYR